MRREGYGGCAGAVVLGYGRSAPLNTAVECSSSPQHSGSKATGRPAWALRLRENPRGNDTATCRCWFIPLSVGERSCRGWARRAKLQRAALSERSSALMVTSTALFCSRNSGAEAIQRSLYQGPQFVYTFHADAVTPLLALGQRLSGLLGPAQLASPIHSSTGGLKTFASVLAPEKTFASVAGSMSSLNVLLELPPMDTGTFRLSTHPAQLQANSPTTPP